MKLKLLLIVFSVLIVSCGKGDKKTEYSEEKSPNTLQQESSDKKSAEEKKENIDSNKANDNPPNNNSTNNKRYESFDDEKPVAVITPMDAGDYNGKTVTVKGFVADIYKNEKVAYLNFVEKYPDNPFTGVIFARVFSDFPDILKFKNKNVELTGRVSVYKGKPQIIINKPSQIKMD